MKRIENKVAAIFGATSGIGKSTAIRFACEGACVMVAGRNEERGAAVVKEICDAGGKAFFMKVDVLKEEDIVNAIKKTVETFGKLDILVNCAGNAWNKPIEQLTTEDWDLTMNTNLIYDDTILIVDTDHPNGHKAVQFFEGMLFGFTYTFSSKK